MDNTVTRIHGVWSSLVLLETEVHTVIDWRGSMWAFCWSNKLMWQRHSSNLYLVSWHAIGRAIMFPQCLCDVFKQAHCAPECVEELYSERCLRETERTPMLWTSHHCLSIEFWFYGWTCFPPDYWMEQRLESPEISIL